MKNNILLAFVISMLVITFSLTSCTKLSSDKNNTDKKIDINIAYDRIISSGTIKAGYVVYPPGCFVDKDTNEVRGIFPDILRELCKNAGLEITFTEEVGFGTMIEGLETGRYDILGSPVWGNTSRAKITMMSDPVHYTAIGVWVRPDEKRFSSNNEWECFNDPQIRIAAMDGSIPLAITKAQFPKATLVTYPDLAGISQLLLDVAVGKVDVLFTEPEKGFEFLESNPGKLINIAEKNPLRIFPNLFMMRKNEAQLKNMIDIGIAELQNSGFINRTLRKYEPYPGVYPRVASKFEPYTPEK